MLSETDGKNIFKNITQNNLNMHDINTTLENTLGDILESKETRDDDHDDDELVCFKTSQDNAEHMDVYGCMCDGCEKLLYFINNGIVLYEIDKYHCNVCNCTDLCEECFNENIESNNGIDNIMCKNTTNELCKCELVKSKHPELNEIPEEFL